MTLFLDHQQRLNIIALLGAQKANVAEMRMFWKLQDALELTGEEKETIEYRIATQGGIEVPSWNQAKGLPPREFDLSDAEVMRVKKCIEEWPQFFTAPDRKWLEPVLEQLANVNTQPAPR
jgi:hypothetical protein